MLSEDYAEIVDEEGDYSTPASKQLSYWNSCVSESAKQTTWHSDRWTQKFNSADMPLESILRQFSVLTVFTAYFDMICLNFFHIVFISFKWGFFIKILYVYFYFVFLPS
jgi:hypothetical protein